MSDISAARREARRRKILQNAEHRLTKIAGNDKFNVKCDNLSHIEENGMSSTKSPSETYISNGLAKAYEDEAFENRNSQNRLNFIELSRSNNAVGENDDDNSDLTVEHNEDKVSLETSPGYYQWVYHISLVLLAVVVKFLFAFDLGFVIADNMVVPYLLMTVSRMVLIRKKPASLSGLFKTALLLCGISPQKVSYLLVLFEIINQILLEFCIYLFTFVTVYILFGSLWIS